MGELLFTLGYGGSLIIIGFIMRAYVKKMEVTKEQTNSKSTKLEG